MLHAVLAAGILLGACAPAARPTPGVRIWRDARWTHGEVIVAADPDTVFRAISDLERWPEIFTYLARVDVESNMVRTTSHRGSRRVLRIATEPAERRIHVDEIGGRAPALAIITLEPSGPSRTRVRAALHARLSRALLWLVGAEHVHRLCAAELTQELSLVRAYFARRITPLR